MKLLTASVIAFSTVVAFAEESKFTDLLTKGLEGWQFITKEGEKPADTAFKISDGILSTSGTPIGYLRTKETFKNYTLSFEWRWQPNTEKNNSGVLVHASTPNPPGAWPKSFEAQLEHGNAGDFWCIGETLKAAGESPNNGKRWLRTADPKEKPLGEWNTMTVVCSETEIIVTVNGVVTNQGKTLSTNQGAIAFQAEGFPIEISNVLVTK
ncbi:MAG: DUF1080 domain-containing protein [Akkermansiaceae bacterium]|jgi:hypothetical protein